MRMYIGVEYSATPPESCRRGILWTEREEPSKWKMSIYDNLVNNGYMLAGSNDSA